jgi:hypothetical protein
MKASASICPRNWRGEVKLAPAKARLDRMESHEAWVGDEVKMDVLVAGQPAIVFVGIQVVKDDMNFPVGMVGDDAVHEVQEFDSPTALVMAGFDQTGGHLQRRKQVVVP